MPDKRVVTRQEPITVEVASTGQEFAAKPLFWRDRADLGNEVVTEYSRVAVQAAPMVVKDAEGNSSLQYQFGDIDYPKLLKMAYPEQKNGVFDRLDIFEQIDVLKVGLEANGLQRLNYMVDPRLKDPLTTAFERAEQTFADGQRTPSTTDAFWPESIPTQSNDETVVEG